MGIVVAGVASLVAAVTEPALPALMKPLLDKGFVGAGIPLWLVPVAIIGLFTLRGLAGFVAQYALTWAANQASQVLRMRLFDHLLRAEPGLFTRHSASSLTNMLVYEVQGASSQLVNSVLTLVRDSLTLVALMAYLVVPELGAHAVHRLVVPGHRLGDAHGRLPRAAAHARGPACQRRAGLRRGGKRAGLAHRAPARRRPVAGQALRAAEHSAAPPGAEERDARRPR